MARALLSCNARHVPMGVCMPFPNCPHWYPKQYRPSVSQRERALAGTVGMVGAGICRSALHYPFRPRW